MKERIIGVVMIVVILIGFASYSGTFAWISTTVDENALDANIAVGRMFTIEGELGSRSSTGNKKIMVPGENLIVRPLKNKSGQTTAAAATTTDVNGNTVMPVSVDDYETCKLSIRSDSTIETQLRLKIEYSYLEYDSQTGQVSTVGADPLCVYGNTAADPNGRFKVGFSELSKWVYNSTDGFWYYNPTEAASDEAGYLIFPPTYEEELTTAPETTTEAETPPEQEPEVTAATPETTAEPETTARPETKIDLIDYICYDPDYYTDNTIADYSTVWSGKEVRVKLTVQAKQARYVNWEGIEWGTIVEQEANLGA